jgi:hypothetical protein
VSGRAARRRGPVSGGGVGRPAAEALAALRVLAGFTTELAARDAALAALRRCGRCWPGAAIPPPTAAITGAGSEITTCRRLRFPDNRFTQSASPHVLGSARLP